MSNEQQQPSGLALQYLEMLALRLPQSYTPRQLAHAMQIRRINRSIVNSLINDGFVSHHHDKHGDDYYTAVVQE